MKLRIIFLSLTVLLASLLFPSGVKKEEVKSFNSFISGKLKGTAVSNKDKLTLGIRTEKLSVPEEEYFLAADISEKGEIFIGTGHNGKLYRIGKNGKSKSIFTAKEPDIYAVLAAKDGSVYFGTSPRGRVYKVDTKGKTEEFFNPDEKYIWDLKEDRSGNIICAVGGSGAVYSIDASGNSRKLFGAKDTHILSLYITSGNTVVAGSSPKGLLYGVKNGKVSVLDDTSLNEIRDICGDHRGNIYYVSSKGTEKKSIFKNDMGLSKSLIKRNSDNFKFTGRIYRLDPEGNVELLWVSANQKFGSIYSIAYDKVNNALLAGSSKGKLFRIKNINDYSLVFEGDSDTIYKLIERDKNFYMLFNNTPGLIKGYYRRRESGVYFSDVFDLGHYSYLGKLYWTPGNDNFKGISLSVRAGNTEVPDESWTEWSAPIEGRKGSDIGIKGFGYSQVKISLRSSEMNRNPSVLDFKFYYVQSNLKPVLMNIGVDTLGKKRKKKLLKGIQKKTDVSGKVKISWFALDPNRDKLEFSLYMRKQSDKQWFTLVKNITGNSYEFSKNLFEDGLYRVKIVADDSLSNSPESSLKKELISDIFTVDSTPPVLSEYKMSAGTVTFRVSDDISVISGVNYSLDGKRWEPLFPDDGIADSFTERYTLKKSDIKSPKGIIFFKVTDENMNFRIYQKKL